MFKRAASVDILHVPYKGSAARPTDLMGGQVLSMIETVPAAQGSIKAGKLRALVTSAERAGAARHAHRRRGRARISKSAPCSASSRPPAPRRRSSSV